MIIRRAKLWIKTKNGMIFVSSLTTFLIMLAIFLPMVLSPGINKGNITALTRDGNSGSYESFNELIIKKDEKELFSSNVIEVNGSSTMQTKVESNENAIGYVSASQLIDYDASPTSGKPEEMVYKSESVNVLKFNGVFPNKENIQYDNINGEEYEGNKTFNVFFRIDEEEKYQWDFDTNTGDWTLPEPSKQTKATQWSEQVMGFAFYNYLLYSTEVLEVLPLSSSTGEIAFLGEDGPADKLHDELVSHGVDPSKKIEILTSGSRSVMTSLTRSFNNSNGIIEDEKYCFKEVMNSSGIITELNSGGHNGSGDAFKKSGPNTATSLGFLSREAELEELELWGYSLEDGSDAFYGGWDNDALIIFVNKNNPVFKNNGDNITTEQMRLIYLFGSALNWEDLIIK